MNSLTTLEILRLIFSAIGIITTVCCIGGAFLCWAEYKAIKQ